MREIEKSIIGSLLIDDKSIIKVLDLTPEMFEDGLFSAAFYKIKEAFEHGRQVDLTTLAADLANGYVTAPPSVINRILSECVADTITSGNIEEYGERLRDEYKRREAAKLFDSISGAKDMNAALMGCVNKITDLITDANDDGCSLADMVSKYKGDYFREKEKEYIYFGFENVDRAIGGADPGDVTVIAARPAVGKSALALQIARYLAGKNKKVGYFNLEMKNNQIYERIVASESGVGLQKIRHDTSAKVDDFKRFMEANDKLATEKNLVVFDGSRTVLNIRQKVMKEHFDVIIIDYMQLIIPGTSRGANRTAEVGDISREIKALATDFDIHIIALSQLNRASEQRPTKEPTMSEIRESGSIEQDASNILIMWNPDDEDRTKKTLKVEKARNGSQEKIDLLFDGPRMKFSEVVWKDAGTGDCPFS